MELREEEGMAQEVEDAGGGEEGVFHSMMDLAMSIGTRTPEEVVVVDEGAIVEDSTMKLLLHSQPPHRDFPLPKRRLSLGLN